MFRASGVIYQCTLEEEEDTKVRCLCAPEISQELHIFFFLFVFFFLTMTHFLNTKTQYSAFGKQLKKNTGIDKKVVLFVLFVSVFFSY